MKWTRKILLLYKYVITILKKSQLQTKFLFSSSQIIGKVIHIYRHIIGDIIMYLCTRYCWKLNGILKWLKSSTKCSLDPNSLMLKEFKKIFLDFNTIYNNKKLTESNRYKVCNHLNSIKNTIFQNFFPPFMHYYNVYSNRPVGN